MLFWMEIRKRPPSCTPSWYPLFKALFFETNPIPVKTILAGMGKITEEFRLPLCKISDGNRGRVLEVARSYGLVG